MKNNNVGYRAAITVLWALLILGSGGLLVLVPALANELTAEFSEYRSDYMALVALLGTPVLIGLAILTIILILLRRIRHDKILTSSSFGSIKGLIIATSALSASFVSIAAWLSFKNTLPPVILIVLTTFSLIALAVALVTSVLYGLLRKAVMNSEELSEVI
ncbi:MAG: hypothetical protein RLZZ41_745 [Actinomycetota bacterium]